MDDQPATKGDLQKARQELKGDIQQLKEELTEAIHDSETRLLKAFYSFAESNQKRLSASEQESSSLKDRMGIIESRLTDVEKRLNMPPQA